MCFRPSLTSVVERNIKEENELFQWRTELVAIFKGRKEPLSSAEVRCGIIGFALREVSAGATKILTKQFDSYKTKNWCRVSLLLSTRTDATLDPF